MLESPPNLRWAETLLYTDLNLVHLSIISFYHTFSYIIHSFIFSFPVKCKQAWLGSFKLVYFAY